MANNLIKYSAACVLTCTALSSASANTAELPGEFSGGVSIVSDYLFRGISQTDENPAIQGNIDWGYDIDDSWSVTIGTWASNVDFNDNSEASSEIDVYGGVSYSVDNWSFDMAVTYYVYPGATNSLNYDYVEYGAGAGYDFEFMQIGAKAIFSPENFGETGEASYYEIGTEIPLPHNFSLNSHFGYQLIDDEASFGVPDYATWGVGIGYHLMGLDLGVNYVDTNIDKSDCADGCDSRVIVSVSKSL